MMTQNRASTANGTHLAGLEGKSYYEQQRELLISEIAQSLEHVLQNINRLNRSLEEVVQVGNEFAPVESLWSHFENVMAKDPEEEGRQRQGEGEGEATERGESEGVTEGGEGETSMAAEEK